MNPRAFSLKWCRQRFGRVFLRLLFLIFCTVLGASAVQGEEAVNGANEGLVTVIQEGQAGGIEDASSRGCSPLGCCVGYIPSEPQHVMRLSSQAESLSVSVRSGGDTTLVVQGPVGWWCNDDFDDLNPALSGRWAAGEYEIYVGAFGEIQDISYDLMVTSEESFDLIHTGPSLFNLGQPGPLPILPDLDIPVPQQQQVK